MITLVDMNMGEEHVVVPTIFPDKTSQVWHLPEFITKSTNVKVIWNFEEEREIFDIYGALACLDVKARRTLYIPYLPYARQDKNVSNNNTFNLHTFSFLINKCAFDEVTSIDVHNFRTTKKLINNFQNISVNEKINETIKNSKPTYLVAPDAGAFARYEHFLYNPTIVFKKERNQETGEITGLSADLSNVKSGDSFLMLDDLCDGGGTFIQISKKLHEAKQNIGVNLYVTHGLFSKGKQILYEAGVNEIFTTNSLLRNKDGIKL